MLLSYLHKHNKSINTDRPGEDEAKTSSLMMMTQMWLSLHDCSGTGASLEVSTVSQPQKAEGKGRLSDFTLQPPAVRTP